MSSAPCTPRIEGRDMRMAPSTPSPGGALEAAGDHVQSVLLLFLLRAKVWWEPVHTRWGVGAVDAQSPGELAQAQVHV